MFLCVIPLWAACGHTHAKPTSSHPNHCLIVPVPPPPNCSWSMARLTDPEPSYQELITASCALCASPFADLGSCGSTAQDIPQPGFPFSLAEASGALPHRRIPFIHPGYPAPAHLLAGDPSRLSPPGQAFFDKALPRAAPPRLPLARPAPPCSATDRPADLPPSLVRPPHYRRSLADHLSPALACDDR